MLRPHVSFSADNCSNYWHPFTSLLNGDACPHQWHHRISFSFLPPSYFMTTRAALSVSVLNHEICITAVLASMLLDRPHLCHWDRCPSASMGCILHYTSVLNYVTLLKFSSAIRFHIFNILGSHALQLPQHASNAGVSATYRLPTAIVGIPQIFNPRGPYFGRWFRKRY